MPMLLLLIQHKRFFKQKLADIFFHFWLIMQLRMRK